MAKERRKYTKTITYRETVGALAGTRVSYPSELSGLIREINIEWPIGCNNLVQVAFGRGSEWLLPTTPATYMALNNATVKFALESARVVRDDRVWLEIRNTDGLNPHTISAIAIVEGVQYREEEYVG